MGLFIGQKLRLSIYGLIKIAEIIEIQDEFVILLSEGKKIKIQKDFIIKTISKKEIEKQSKVEEQCKNCMEYKNGNCIGLANVCEDYRNVPKISSEELNRWPKNGNVSRKKSNKYIIREYDSMYNKYNTTYH